MAKNSFSVVSWNVDSLKSKRRPKKSGAMSMSAWFSHISPTVVAFQETTGRKVLKS